MLGHFIIYMNRIFSSFMVFNNKRNRSVPLVSSLSSFQALKSSVRCSFFQFFSKVRVVVGECPDRYPIGNTVNLSRGPTPSTSCLSVFLRGVVFDRPTGTSVPVFYCRSSSLCAYWLCLFALYVSPCHPSFLLFFVTFLSLLSSSPLLPSSVLSFFPPPPVPSFDTPLLSSLLRLFSLSVFVSVCCVSLCYSSSICSVSVFLCHCLSLFLSLSKFFSLCVCRLVLPRLPGRRKV